MQRSKRVTIRDIAKSAGVSPATISMALNNKGNLPEQRRKEIQKLAAKMGYVPNPMARALRGGNIGCVGLLINYFNNPFYRAFYSGMESAAEESGFAYTVSQHLDNLEREKRQVQKLADLGMDGLIILPSGNESEHLQELVRIYKIPVVLISHTLESFPAVEADNVRGGRLIARHFLECLPGRTNVHLAGKLEKSALMNRKVGFCEVMQEHDPSFSPEANVFVADALTAESGYSVMSAIAGRHKSPFNLFAVNDEVAMGVLRYCREHGLRIPEDVAVAGCSNIDILETYGIRLTSVHIPARQIALTALEYLLDLISNENARDYPPTITYPVTLVVRGSTVGGAAAEGPYHESSC